jgi:16S rRNA (cytosine1402-N4)-methyltransferase
MRIMQESRHTPVLVKEILGFFKEISIHNFVDATLGAGGHAHAFLNSHPEIKNYIGIDQDHIARELAKENLKEFSDKLNIVAGNAVDLRQHLQELGVEGVDGILIDCGVSSMQLDEAERGFSFRFNAPLDMRMNQTSELTAETIINHYSEKDIEKILREYGEQPQSKRVASEIVRARKKKRICTTFDLSEALSPLFPRRGKLHPMTLIFQALRIYVNDELRVLENFIPQAVEALNPGGRLCVISFHSLEDRIVKNQFRDLKKQHLLLSKKPIIASDEEKKQNPRARSAKLRVLEK